MKKTTAPAADDPSAAFWESVERSAAAMKHAPAWMKAGVDVDERHFVTFRPTSVRGSKPRR